MRDLVDAGSLSALYEIGRSAGAEKRERHLRERRDARVLVARFGGVVLGEQGALLVGESSERGAKAFVQPSVGARLGRGARTAVDHDRPAARTRNHPVVAAGVRSLGAL